MKINLLQYFQGDKIIWAITIALSLISILVVYSSSSTLAYRLADGDTEHFLIKHTFLVILSLATAWLAHRIDYRYYSKLSRVALVVSVPLLLFAWQFGDTYNEASRWITIPFINYSFQPSDLAKLALVLSLASMLSKRQSSLEDFENAIQPMMVWVCVICGLIAMTNWSTGTLLFMTCLLIFYLGRVPSKYILLLFLGGLLAGMLAFTVGQRGGTVKSRITSYLSSDEVAFQAEQSYIALASGGVLGQGAGKSTQRNFLPQPYSDFIFAIIVEEYGFVGGVAVILMYLALLYRGVIIVTESSRIFGGLVAAGLIFSLVLQAFAHIGVVVGLFPITGLPLPLLSMGGTSLIFTGANIGILISISKTNQLENLAAGKTKKKRKFNFSNWGNQTKNE